MEFVPVAKRTRSQKAKMLKEANRKARLAARNQWKKEREKEKEEIFGSNCGGKKAEFLRVLEENGDDVILIDEDEFLNPDYKCGSAEKPVIGEVGILKKEVFNDDDDEDVVYQDNHKTPLFNDGKGKGVFVNDEGSDSSLQILEERYNPLGVDDVVDDEDDDVDVVESHKREKVDNVASEAPSYSSDDVADEDFAEAGETSDRSESSSSDNFVEEVEERELHSSDDVDDGDDDNEVRLDNRKESDFDFAVHNHVYIIDDCDDDFEDGDDHVDNHQKNHDDANEVRHSKRRERIFYGETKRRELSIDEERKQENGVKAKRGRSPKNKNVVESEFIQPCSKKVRKASKDVEIQNSLLNTILEKGNKGLDEILANANEELYLPMKFKYGVEEVIVDEKTEKELEVDDYFKELDFALQASNIGVDDSFVHDNEGGGEDSVLSNDTISQKELCAKGKHYLIHDDEIGVLCKFCSYVHLEIRHVMPEFNEDPFGRGNRRGYYRNRYEESVGFQFPDCSYEHGGDQYPDPSDDIQGTVWDLIPGVKRTLYPHQRDGFEFIWKNIAGGIRIDELDKLTKFGLGGCIICHAPGTGKTRLATVFVQSFMKQYQEANPMIVVPSCMLRPWQEEFARWNADIPFLNLNDNELSIPKYAGSTYDHKTIRYIKLSTWASGKGVLGISYSLLTQLADEAKGIDENVRKILLTKPGIVVLDEGHTARNDKSKIWRVLCQISTKSRVILSGTPFQNNFEELHNTIALVREELGVPILSGFYEQSIKRIEELKKRIKPFVHVHKGEILRETLKGLFHSIIMLNPSYLQTKCFQLLERSQLNRFTFERLVTIAAVHPSIILKENLGFVDKAFKDKLEERRMDLNAGVKTRFLVELIKLSKGERVLVFGQYISPLKFIAGLLESVFCWTMGTELLYIDGQQNTKERQSTIRLFNDPKSEARVLLASTKACCEGIHLVGASRVVLLDVVWNPSVERQAISRAYRLGQKKDVFVYHLITSNTLEEDKFRKQATKEFLSELMFSSSDESLLKKSNKSKISGDRVLKEMICHEKMKPLFEKIIYQPKTDLIENF